MSRLSFNYCCSITLILCATCAGAFDVEIIGSNPYELHPAQAPSSSLRLTGWLPRQPASVAGGLGLTLAVPGGAVRQPFPTAPTKPLTLDLGVRWRSALGSNLHMEFSAWGQSSRAFANNPSTHDAMGMIRQRDVTSYGTRMELQWSNAPARGLLPEHGAIGMQLQGGSRVVLRARRGGPMVYFRSRF